MFRNLGKFFSKLFIDTATFVKDEVKKEGKQLIKEKIEKIEQLIEEIKEITLKEE